MDEFTEAYITCALWATNDESDESGGVPLDDNYGFGDIHPDTLQEMVNDCEQFQRENADDIATWESSQYTAAEMAGHDFWLTREGHGAGFWDGDWDDAVGKRLTIASERFGEFGLCVGDHGQIYSL